MASVWKAVYRSERDDWILAMCAAGMGFGFLPEFCINHQGVVARPVVEPEFWREVNIVTVRGRPHSPAVGALVREAMRNNWMGEKAIADAVIAPACGVHSQSAFPVSSGSRRRYFARPSQGVERMQRAMFRSQRRASSSSARVSPACPRRRRWRKAPVDLVVIDRHNYHLFQPLLYQVATAGLSPADIASPIRQILGRQANTTVMLAKVSRESTSAARRSLPKGGASASTSSSSRPARGTPISATTIGRSTPPG